MVIDTSALVAILQDEPERRALTDAILTASSPRMSAATLVEAGIVMQGRHGDVGSRDLDVLLSQTRVEVVPLTAAHADFARDAFRRFGKGRHPAGLNYGDCFAYALATALAEPLLFVGSDFDQTDVAAAVY
ncbi:MAG: type II toxin-antitoxin system VapC family toxin [Rhodothermales bacterium]